MSNDGESEPPVETVDALVQTAFVTMATLTRIAADNDLSLTQLRVLGILQDRRLRMRELADFLGLEKSTLSGLVDRAEARGLVERAPSGQDRRAVDVRLTAAGIELAAAVRADVGRSLARLTRRLDADEHRRLQALLGRLLGPPEPTPN